MWILAKIPTLLFCDWLIIIYLLLIINNINTNTNTISISITVYVHKWRNLTHHQRLDVYPWYMYVNLYEMLECWKLVTDQCKGSNTRPLLPTLRGAIPRMEIGCFPHRDHHLPLLPPPTWPPYPISQSQVRVHLCIHSLFWLSMAWHSKFELVARLYASHRQAIAIAQLLALRQPPSGFLMKK